MESEFKSLAADLDLKHYEDWVRFDARLTESVRAGRARRVPTLRILHMPSEEWYLEPSSGEIYVYVRPDDKIFPKWERVDIFAMPQPIRSCDPGLHAIPRGRMDGAATEELKVMLKLLVRQGVAEIVDPPREVEAPPGGTIQTWYLDRQTNALFRMIEERLDGSSRWERIPLRPNGEGD